MISVLFRVCAWLGEGGGGGGAQGGGRGFVCTECRMVEWTSYIFGWFNRTERNS